MQWGGVGGGAAPGEPAAPAPVSSAAEQLSVLEPSSTPDAAPASPPPPLEEQEPAGAGPGGAAAAVAASSQPWRRRINASVLKRVINIKPKVLRQRFGWHDSHGPPRMRISVGGQALEAEPGVFVMELNKEGRDGFPFKSRWVGMLLEALGAAAGDTLVLQHTRSDGDGVIHAAASLERLAGQGGVAGAPSASPDSPWTPSATLNDTAGCNSDFPTCSVASDARQQGGEGEAGEVQQPGPAAKRARMAAGAPGPAEHERQQQGGGKPALLCPHCGREFVYRASFAKHVGRCPARAEEGRLQELLQRGGGGDGAGRMSLDGDIMDDVADTLVHLSGLPSSTPPDGAQQPAAAATPADGVLTAAPDAPQAEHKPAAPARQGGGRAALPASAAQHQDIPDAASQPHGADMKAEEEVAGSELPPQQPPAPAAPAPAAAAATRREASPPQPSQEQQQRSRQRAPGGMPPAPAVVRKALMSRRIDPDTVEGYMRFWVTMTPEAQLQEWREIIREHIRTNEIAELESYLQGMSA